VDSEIGPRGFNPARRCREPPSCAMLVRSGSVEVLSSENASGAAMLWVFSRQWARVSGCADASSKREISRGSRGEMGVACRVHGCVRT